MAAAAAGRAAITAKKRSTISAMWDAGIVLLTYNGEKYLEQVLQMLPRQKAREIIAIDSGSTDSTLQMLQRNSVRIHQITQAEFSHSRTRNLAAKICTAKYAVFLTQDATPADSCWLDCLLRPFETYPRVAATFSRQIPRPGSDLLEANDLTMYFKTVRQVKTLPENAEYYRKNIWDFIQFSNSSAAYDRSVLLENPFDETLEMGEDQEFAKRMLEKGYGIVYEPESMVLHSHDHSISEKYRRNLRMGAAFSRFLSATLGKRPFPVGAWLYHVSADFFFLASNNASFGNRLKWLVRSPVHRAFMHYAYFKGWNSIAGKNR